MQLLLDTSFLFALIDNSDKSHEAILAISRRKNVNPIVPNTVLPELCYLVASRIGHKTMQTFLSQLVKGDDVHVESVTVADLQRASEILEQYSDSQLDFVDATIVAISERRKITTIGTLDRRDFSIIRPKHCDYFELVP